MDNEWFEKAPVHKAYFKFGLPVVFGMIVSLVYNMVDTYFIARTGNTDLVAGVSLGAPIFILMVAIGDIFGLGGSSVISRLFGEKRDDDGRRISAFCFYISLLTGVAVAVIMMVFRQPILHLLGADPDTMPYASGYYTYIALGAPFLIVSFTPSNHLRTEGFAAQSMKGSIIGSVVNIILDPLFIFGFGWGAAGAAIATVIGNMCADVYYIWVLKKKSRKLSIDIRDCKITLPEFGQVLAIGIPASVTNIMQSLGITLTNRFLLPYGNNCVAAMGIVMKTGLLASFVLIGFAFGPQPLVGYNYGAKNKARLRQILRFCYGFECAAAAVLSVLISLAAPFLLGMFMQDESIIAIGTPMLRLQQAGMIFVAVVLVSICIFQATGKAWGAFFLSVSRQGVIFAIVIVTASQLFGYMGVLASQAVADALTAVLAVGWFWQSVYKEIR